MKLFFLSLLVFTSLRASAQAPVFQFTCFDINSGTGDSNPNNICIAGNKLIFVAADTAHGKELWTSDGTVAGTHMITDLVPGPDNTIFGAELCAVNNLVFFSPHFPNFDPRGGELWVTDGTAAGTRFVKEICPGTNSAQILRFYAYKGKAYFGASNENANVELWCSDGTAAGTVMLKEINPGINGSAPANFTECNGKLYFTARDDAHGIELWVIDGTANGTHMVKDINTPQPGQAGSGIHYIIPYKEQVFFTADDGVHGREPWLSDGTEAGTFMLKDINNVNPSGSVNYYSGGMQYRGKFYFTADNDTNGAEMWVTDGTTAGTHMVMDMDNSKYGSYATPAARFNNLLFFGAVDNSTKLGGELYSMDGTPQSIKLLKDINTSPYKGGGAGLPTVYNARMYFISDDAPPINNPDPELYYSDGTEIGTYKIKPAGASNAAPLHYTTQIVEFNGALFFAASYDGRGLELWKLEDTVHHPDNVVAVKMQDKPFMLYPNPAKNNCTLYTPGTYTNGQVQVYDMGGRLVYHAAISGSYHTIPLQSIPKGLYTVTLIQDGNAVSQRLVVE